MFQRFVTAFLTTGFAAISLLGHGGLHALPGGHACHRGHVSNAATPADTHAVAHNHDGCCHHGTHSHSESGHQEPAQPVPLPLEHDHENCLICQWHAQGQVAVVDVIVPLSDVGTPPIIQTSSQVASADRLTTLFTRGPPATA